MKNKRQQRILEIIAKNSIQTQDELLSYLCSEGYSVTQATVSRDIKELNLVKMRAADGTICYTRHEAAVDLPDGEKYAQIMRSSAKNVDYAGNLVVIRCYMGMANAACASLNAMKWDESVLGTLAGDDTILIVTRSEKHARVLCSDLRSLLALD